jgi:hypothetical protein
VVLEDIAVDDAKLTHAAQGEVHGDVLPEGAGSDDQDAGVLEDLRVIAR